jgi:hypothetical protein
MFCRGSSENSAGHQTLTSANSVWAPQLPAPTLQLSPPPRPAIYSFENLDWI